MNIKGKTFLYTCICAILLAGCSTKDKTTSPFDDNLENSSSSYSKSSDKDNSPSSNNYSKSDKDQKLTQDDFLNPDIEYGELNDIRDGHVYKTVKIGIQTWMAQNLELKTENSKESRYFCGRLYPWGEAVDIEDPFNTFCSVSDVLNYQGICPDGWHLPAPHDWAILANYVKKQGYSDLSAALKSKRNNAWPNDSTATDVFGFSVVYGGYILYNGDYVTYGYDDTESCLWFAEERGPAFSYNYAKEICFSAEGVGLTSGAAGAGGGTGKKQKNFVRCIKNYDIDDGAKPAPKVESVYDSVANTLTDLRDSQVYKTVQIADQVWMAENLAYVTDGGYADPGVGSKCITIKDSIYSCFYRWNAAMDIPSGTFNETFDNTTRHQGICPSGWHIPSKNDFEQLFTNVGSNLEELIFNDEWCYTKNTGSNSGFNLRPLGYDINCGFENFSYYAGLWMADNDSTTGGAYLFQYYDRISESTVAKHKYLSVRCIMDKESE